MLGDVVTRGPVGCLAGRARIGAPLRSRTSAPGPLSHRRGESEGEDGAGMVQGDREGVYLGAGGVNVEAGAGRGGQLVVLHERLGAVVASADADAFAVQQGGEVVRVD